MPDAIKCPVTVQTGERGEHCLLDANLVRWLFGWGSDHKAMLRQIASALNAYAKLPVMISGALRSCIDAHGPITKYWTTSATKRILHSIAGEAAEAAKGREAAP